MTFVVVALRMVLQLLVGVVSLRITIEILGIEVYSAYAAVFGLVFFFSFLQTAVQSLGNVLFNKASISDSKDGNYLAQTFSISLLFYILFGVIMLIPIMFMASDLGLNLELIDLGLLVIFVISNFIVTSLSSFLLNYLILLKKNKIHLIFSFFELFLKCLSIAVLYLLSIDTLIGYALLLFLVQLIFASIIYIYTHFSGLSFHKGSLSGIYRFAKDVISLSGEHFSYSINGYGFSTMLIKFFGAQIGLIRNVALQLTMVPSTLGSFFYSALMPQFFSKARSYHVQFSDLRLAKFVFTIIIIFSLPLLFYCQEILTVWLGKNFPTQITVKFTLVLTLSLYIDSFFLSLRSNIDLSPEANRYHKNLVLISFVYLISMMIILYFFRNIEYAFKSIILFSLITCLYRFSLIFKMIVSHVAKVYLLKYIFSSLILLSFIYLFATYIAYFEIDKLVIIAFLIYSYLLFVLNGRKDRLFAWENTLKLLQTIKQNFLRSI
jgi:hypothetical protein